MFLRGLNKNWKNAYRAEAKFYSGNNNIFGVFPLTENTDTYRKKMDEQTESYEKTLKERDTRIQELDERVAAYEQKEEAELTTDKVLAELESLGIDAKPMPSENEGLISCEISGCKLVFDVSI